VVRLILSFLLWGAVVAAQVSVKITDSTAAERIVAAAGREYDSTMTTVPDSNTAVTTTTTKVQLIWCANTTGNAVTLTMTDNQQSPKTYVPAVSLPANSVTVMANSPVGIRWLGGIKWQAGTASALNCQIVGVQ
jgi:hypothetical protein